jgi:hypothetical protein
MTASVAGLVTAPKSGRLRDGPCAMRTTSALDRGRIPSSGTTTMAERRGSAEVVVFYAGLAAEHTVLGRPFPPNENQPPCGVEGDFAEAWVLLLTAPVRGSSFVGDDAYDRADGRLRRQALKLMAQHRMTVERFAKALPETGTLSGYDVEAIVWGPGESGLVKRSVYRWDIAEPLGATEDGEPGTGARRGGPPPGTALQPGRCLLRADRRVARGRAPGTRLSSGRSRTPVQERPATWGETLDPYIC